MVLGIGVGGTEEDICNPRGLDKVAEAHLHNLKHTINYDLFSTAEHAHTDMFVSVIPITTTSLIKWLKITDMA